MSHDPKRLRHFIESLAGLLDQHPDEATLLDRGHNLLASLVAQDDWLPEELAQPDPQRYQQYLCTATRASAFGGELCLGPWQRTPVHDHRVWGLIGHAARRRTLSGL